MINYDFATPIKRRDLNTMCKKIDKEIIEENFSKATNRCHSELERAAKMANTAFQIEQREQKKLTEIKKQKVKYFFKRVFKFN